MLTYIETLYENKNVSSTDRIDENTFALLLMISAGAKDIRELDDIVDEDPYLDGVFETDKGNCSGMRAFLEMITGGRDDRWRGREDCGRPARAMHAAKINDLATKGYYVGTWEEGNVAIACEGYESVAREAVSN